jgi:photosystem II stability/assembly factor-like uncharacterized protein
VCILCNFQEILPVKKESFVCLIVLAILAPSCGGGSGGGAPRQPPLVPRWESQFRKPTTSNLRAVRFDTAGAQGIVAGEAGTFIRTDDSGATWTQLEHAPAARTGDILAMSVQGTTAVAVGSEIGTGRSSAWTTLDATSWFMLDDAVSRFAQPWVDVVVAFPAAQLAAVTYRLRPNGMVDLYQGSFLFSLDSTKNYVPPMTPVPDTPWGTANGMVFFGGSGYGLLCGENGGNAQIRRTADNGQIWDTLTINGGPFPPLRRFAMLSLLTGFVCGDGGTVLQTTNGGTWNLLNNKPGGLTTTFRGVTFVDVNTGWAVGDGGTIYKFTYVAPNWTWTAQTSGTTEDLYDVFFANASVGYTVGNRGTVLRTADGGTSWQNKSQPAANPFPQINAVDFAPDGLTGLAVGPGGLVLRTLDGGKTWLNFNSSVGAVNLTGVTIPRSGSGNVAYICGTNSVLQQSDLKGLLTSAWTSQTIPTGSYSAILFPGDDLKGVVVGSAGELRHTIDGGTNWVTPTTAPPTGTNYRTLCVGGGRVFAAGDSGIVINSDYTGAPGADVWANSPTIAGAPQVNSLQAPMGSFSLFAGAADGKVYRLDAAMAGPWDGSVAAIQGAGNPVVGVAFTGSSGMAVVQGAANGGVFYTQDGGGTWSRSYLHVKIGNGPPASQLRAIRMLDAVLGWAVGDGGMILKTTTGGR